MCGPHVRTAGPCLWKVGRPANLGLLQVPHFTHSAVSPGLQAADQLARSGRVPPRTIRGSPPRCAAPLDEDGAPPRASTHRPAPPVPAPSTPRCQRPTIPSLTPTRVTHSAQNTPAGTDAHHGDRVAGAIRRRWIRQRRDPQRHRGNGQRRSSQLSGVPRETSRGTRNPSTSSIRPGGSP